jgi:hypothetical protein
MKIIIDKNEILNSFQRVRRRDNLEFVLELLELLLNPEDHEEEIIIVRNLLKRKNKIDQTKEELSYQLGLKEIPKHNKIYSFPNYYRVAGQLGWDAEIQPLYKTYDQGDFQFRKNDKEYLVEICSTIEDLITKAKKHQRGECKILQSQELWENDENGKKRKDREFRMVILRAEETKEQYKRRFHPEDYYRVEEFRNALIWEGVKLREPELPRELYDAPNWEYFLNLEQNEHLVERKLRRVLKYFQNKLT